MYKNTLPLENNAQTRTLYALLLSAEKHADQAADISLIRLRQFGEAALRHIADSWRLEIPVDKQHDLLLYLEYRLQLPEEILAAFHRLRTVGNRAVHELHADPADAAANLGHARDIARWIDDTFYAEARTRREEAQRALAARQQERAARKAEIRRRRDAARAVREQQVAREKAAREAAQKQAAAERAARLAAKRARETARVEEAAARKAAKAQKQAKNAVERQARQTAKRMREAEQARLTAQREAKKRAEKQQKKHKKEEIRRLYKEKRQFTAHTRRLQKERPNLLQEVQVLYQRGIACLRANRAEEAFALVLESAQLGYVRGMEQIALWYERGVGHERDPEQAFYWYTRAGEDRAAFSQGKMAEMLLHGIGCKADIPRAVHVLQLAHLNGHDTAAARLAELFSDGRYLPRQADKAAFWREKARERQEKIAAEKKKAITRPTEKKSPPLPISPEEIRRRLDALQRASTAQLQQHLKEAFARLQEMPEDEPPEETR